MSKIKKISKGFTLIELLVVIAVLGVLGVVIFLALNPAQQLARTRDAGRKSGVSQLGRSLEAYAITRTGTYVPESATWMTSLQTAGEISTVPAAIAYSIAGVSACTVNAQNGFCYNATTAAGGGPVVTFARLESQSENSRCTSPAVAYFVWSTADARGGVVCASGQPIPGTQTFLP